MALTKDDYLRALNAVETFLGMGWSQEQSAQWIASEYPGAPVGLADTLWNVANQAAVAASGLELNPEIETLSNSAIPVIETLGVGEYQIEAFVDLTNPSTGTTERRFIVLQLGYNPSLEDVQREMLGALQQQLAESPIGGEPIEPQVELQRIYRGLQEEE